MDVPDPTDVPEVAETRLSGRAVSSSFLLAGALICLAGLGLGFWFFYGSGRLLALWPSLATPVALPRLAADPGRYRGRWVAVRGRLWRVEPGRAVLVPAAYGREMRTRSEVRWLVARGHHHGLSALGISRKPLPSSRVTVVLPRSTRGGTALEADRRVTVLGELERTGGAADRWQLAVRALKQKRRPPAVIFEVAIYGLLSLFFLGVGAVLIRAGVRLDRR